LSYIERIFHAMTSRSLVVSTTIALALALSCHSKDNAAQDAAPPSSAASSASLESALSGAAADDEVRPNYPVEKGAPVDPLAERLCKALHETMETHKATCCNGRPGMVLTGECVRTLSYALRHKAVVIDPADIGKCEAALDASYAGCDWVGGYVQFPTEACASVVHGTLPSGAVCRSSVECSGNLRCHGAGPTTLGRCAPAHEKGGSCGGTVDTLASYTRSDTNLDATHPECTDFCNRRVCANYLAEGAACMLTVECGPKRQCVGGKCVAGQPAKEGEPCKGAACSPELLCLSGKCVAKKAAGEACANDFECKAACLKGDGGKNGTCGMRCKSFL